MTVHGLDGNGEPQGYFATEELIAPIDGQEHPRPTDYPEERVTRLDCGPCQGFELYLYVIPHRLPADNSLDQTPSFKAELRILSGRTRLRTREITINPWGGATLRLRWPE